MSSFKFKNGQAATAVSHSYSFVGQQKQELIVNRKEKEREKKKSNGRLPFMRKFIEFVGGEERLDFYENVPQLKLMNEILK